MNHQGWKKTPPNELMWFEKLLGQTQGSPLFSDLYQGDSDAGKGKLSLPYKSVLKFCPEAFGDEKQVTGDCFVAGTMVAGEVTKPIEDVEIGDEVWTAEGHLTTVVSTRQIISHKPLVQIKTTGGLPITCTSDHRVLAYRMERVGGKRVTHNRYTAAVGGSATQAAKVVSTFEARKAEWVAAGDLTDTDYLLTPLVFEGVKKPTFCHTLFDGTEGMWFLGYLLGNGSVSKVDSHIGLDVPHSKPDVLTRVCQHISKCGLKPVQKKYKDGRKSTQVHVYAKALLDGLRRVLYHGDSKSFPGWAIGDINTLEGLFDADGYVREDLQAFDSTSLSLIHGVVFSAIVAGYNPSVGLCSRSKGTFDNAKPLWRVTLREAPKKQYVWRDDHFLCRPVVNVEFLEGPTVVYDIGVSDKHHSFLANGQAVHNCVSHGTRNGCDIPRAVDIDIKGEPEEWVARGATEHIYGMRGHTGQGMNTARACRFVHEKGFLARAKYGSYDLSRYNAQLGIAWGRTGTPKALQEEAAKQPMRYFAQVSRDRAKAAVEIRSALANGYAVVIGGVGGWSSKRNEKGISQPGGASWNHCMCIGGYDDTCDLDDEPLALVLQSWGKWNGGGHPPWGQIPTGSALIPISYIIDRYVMRGDCIVIGNAQGYPARDLPDYGFDYV